MGALGEIAALMVPQDLFDNARVVDETDSAQAAAALGAGERIRRPGFADQYRIQGGGDYAELRNALVTC